MKTYINPKIITWARERAGLTIEDLAKKIKRDPQQIESWENGFDVPSYTSLEKLAYTCFKIPLALFFFPEPPDIEDPVRKLRRLPSFETEKFSPDTYQKIRLAQAYQDSLLILLRDVRMGRKAFRDILPGNSRPPQLADMARLYLGVSVEEQTEFRSCEKALKAWRHVLEEAGIYTFKDSLEDRFISGFSLLDGDYPIIFINNSNPFSRQVFTLIHEFAHILYGVSGVTDVDESYIGFMDEKQRRLEIDCNEFAGNFLVPSDSFQEDIQYFRELGPKTISEIADRYSVSREVIVRRLLDEGVVTQRFYEEKATEWNEEYLHREKGTKGGNYYLTRLSYLGEGFTRIAFENYHGNRITRADLAQHLNINARFLPKLERFIRW